MRMLRCRGFANNVVSHAFQMGARYQLWIERPIRVSHRAIRALTRQLIAQPSYRNELNGRYEDNEHSIIETSFARTASVSFGSGQQKDGSVLEGTYNLTLVALSYGVAVAASYTALELSRRVSATAGSMATWWLVGGAVSMGVGIWTMHFIGMLAFSMPMTFTYDISITVLSLLVAMAAAGFALFTASRKRNSYSNIGLSGLLLGGGIASMHYTGMAAMRMDATISYDMTLLALSILIAVVAACAAIWMIFTLSTHKSANLGWLKLGAALTMGIAICGMHYTGMAAAIYTPVDFTVHSVSPFDSTLMAATMGTGAFIILGVTHLTIFFDYRLGIEKKHSKVAEQAAVQLSEILDESSNEIYLFDSESLKFVRVNRGAEENLGYTKLELENMTPVDLKPEFTYTQFCEILKPLRDGSKKELLFETTHRRCDGTDYQAQIHLQLSRLTNPPIFVAIITDVTDRKNLEDQLAQAKKMESIGQLAAGIAHEINTPAQFVGDNTRFIKDAFHDLMSVNGNTLKLLKAAKTTAVTQAIIDETEASLEKADLEYLHEEIPVAIDQSLDGITRISNIVRAMKEFSHPGGKDKEHTDLNKAIANTTTVASNEWKYLAELETDFAEDLPLVQCFPQEINQVVLNLVVNAAHAIDETRSDDSSDTGVISITTRLDGTHVEIRLSDTGAGIPDDIKERIFDPFFTTKEVGKGTGQGLAMAYKTIVDQHAGTLEVESVVGQGSTFIIRLPLGSDAAVADVVAA